MKTKGKKQGKTAFTFLTTHVHAHTDIHTFSLSDELFLSHTHINTQPPIYPPQPHRIRGGLGRQACGAWLGGVNEEV